jgi:hypothetical protein
MNISGLYIVTLNNDELISVNAHNPKISEKCIKVNSANCKFGKARNLATRKRNYEKTFGAVNINFLPIAALENTTEAETLILKLLSEWQIRGATGRKNEWLQGIAADEVQRIAISALSQAQIQFVLLV